MLDGLTVGLPRALLHHWYAPAWESFFRALGVRPVVSPPTNKTVLETSLRITLDEVCLPVKLFLGHAAGLVDECDLLFLPHLVMLENKAFTCPKLMGLPDLVRQFLPAAKTLKVKVDIMRRMIWERAIKEAAAALGYRGPRVGRAWQSARRAQMEYEKEMIAGKLPDIGLVNEGSGPSLAVLGHPYCLYDSFLNMDLLRRLRTAGCRLITPETLPAAAIEDGLTGLSKELFWSLGRRQLGAVNYLLARGECRGFIHVSAFACGPEALVGQLVESAVVRAHQPFLRLHLDEHTGEAGVATRIEAFLDMLVRRRR